MVPKCILFLFVKSDDRKRATTLLPQWNFSMPGKPTAVMLCWLYICFVPGGTGQVGPRCCCSELGHSFEELIWTSGLWIWLKLHPFHVRSYTVVCRVVTKWSELFLQPRCSMGTVINMILQDNSLELCNALTVFMATSKDLKFSDCHNELVITSRGEKEKKTKSMLY